MSLQLGALRDALIDGGTSPDLASKAAEEVAAHQSRQSGTNSRLMVLLLAAGGVLQLALFVAIVVVWARTDEISGQLSEVNQAVAKARSI